jgi:ribosomal silencing factor RsfS
MKDTANRDRDRRHRELLDSIENLNKNMGEKLDKQDKRIQTLENWRWYVLGIGLVIVFILNKIPVATFFD